MQERPEPRVNIPVHAAPRRLALLGATGSIGRSTCELVAQSNGALEIVSIAGGSDVEALAAVARRFNVKFAAIADPSRYSALKSVLAGTGIECAAGLQAVIAAAIHPADMVVAAIAGTEGVAPTCAALQLGRTVALANKESLVCAGTTAIRLAALHKARILPMDSEHNAIFQALGGEPPANIEKMILTASGGPFRLWPREKIAAATREEALAHPNWAMGPKVTVDSASLMNKGLELIEAHYLFDVPAEKLDVLVHPQSIVHGLVSFADGAVTAGMACPDMRVPIAHCLFWPQRMATNAPRLDLAKLGSLTFEAPDHARFPALQLAIDALAQGRGLPTVLNAANEIAVSAFLNKRLDFYGMARLVERACNAAIQDGTAREPQTVEEALAVHHIARDRSLALLADTIL